MCFLDQVSAAKAAPKSKAKAKAMGSSKQTTQTSIAFMEVMREPYEYEDNYINKTFTVKGDFWPGMAPSVIAADHKLRVVDVNRSFKGAKGKTVAFKVVSVESDDPNGTGPVTLEEGRNFWWVEKEALRPLP